MSKKVKTKSRSSKAALVCFTTFSDSPSAHQFARTIVARKLAACVNIINNVKSIYTWQDQIEEASECFLICKTSRKGFETLKKEIVSLHSYDVPELIALEIKDGHDAYLKWIQKSVK